MIVAKITIDQAERAAYMLQCEEGHDEVADALLALANDTDLLVTSDGRDDVETARIISAAPEMLAALINLLAEVKMSEKGLSCTSNLAREHAEKAIAKAEGRANG